jgi:ligand-binding SRPBCC domain-containing protein
MQFKITSNVNHGFEFVYRNWNKDLFESLVPFPLKMRIKRFDGSETDSIIELELIIFGKKETWQSIVVKSKKTNSYFYFKDRAVFMPKPLEDRNHSHLILKSKENTSKIIDIINYSTRNFFLDILLFMPLYICFFQRIYL